MVFVIGIDTKDKMRAIKFRKGSKENIYRELVNAGWVVITCRDIRG